MSKSCLRILTCAAATLFGSVTYANEAAENSAVFNPNLDALTITNSISNVNGHVESVGAENIIYPISGPVYATMVNPASGETMGAVMERGSVNAKAAFSVAFFGLLGPWSEVDPTLPWTMDQFAMSIGGTTFSIREDMPLTGRAFPGLGPVADPVGYAALRMAGCAGVVADGEGKYANKVGSLCLNGTFRFDGAFNGIGVSNCTIVLHDPQ
jgi:hypothetical protein